MVAAFSLPPVSPAPARPPGEQRVRLSGIPWAMYTALSDAVDSPGVRMTYCEGELEIMSTSPEHEEAKTILGRLIEMYATERDVPLLGYGSTTFRNPAKERGLEPDECYCLGHRLTDVPDLAIEVVITSGGIEKLPVYQGLGVREVWFWEDDAFHLHALRGNRPGHDEGYEAIPASELLPGLDLGVVAALVRGRDQLEAVRAFRAWLRGGRSE
jgi:Uma2 family endonuclease